MKHYLKSSISQMGLRNMSIISIEYILAANLNYTPQINEFAKVRVRRIKL
jgi:hypothetical protein